MASFKVSEFAGVANTTDDSLLMLSYTTDNGSTYETRKIRIADFLDDITEDPNLSSVITLTGMPTGSTNLGTFTGSTISDNLTIKQALQQLETATEGKQEIVSGGDGIAIDGTTINVDLSAASYAAMTVSGIGAGYDGAYTRAGEWSLDGDTTFSGNALYNANGGYYYFTKDGDAEYAVIYNEFESAWQFVFSSGGDFTSPVDNGPTPTINGLNSVGSTSTIYENSINQPTADSYTSYGGSSFLEFDGGKLKVKVLDEDDMVSNSADYLPTQQSVKSYVDTANFNHAVTAAATYINKDGTLDFAADQSMGGFKLTNLGAPSVSTDAVTKAYVDSATSGQGAFWTTVRVEAHVYGDVDLATGGLLTIDGITLLAGDRVLVESQTNATENGIYVAASGAWTRAADADESSEFTTNKTVYTSEGVDGAGNVHAYVGASNPTLGADDIDFLKKQDSAGIADGSITTLKLADGAVTDAKVSDVAATKLTGTLNNATVSQTNVTQHQAALVLDASQTTTGTFADARISQTSVTQHQAALQITESQITDLQDYALQTSLDATDLNVAALTTLSGVPALSTSLGTFTGSTIADASTVKQALQSLETAVESVSINDLTDGTDVVQAGDNINRLVGSTGADGEPTNYLFLVVDQLDGSIKAIDKTFIEIE